MLSFLVKQVNLGTKIKVIDHRVSEYKPLKRLKELF